MFSCKEYTGYQDDKIIGNGDKRTVPLSLDAQGNPLDYLGHTLTWEKGRQLKSFDGISFTYNANGIRTSKTVDGVRHDYLLDGVNILRETWDDNTLETLFDNEDSVCGIVYNGVPYYFHKNLQGDIIAIADANGDVVARYTYDAWGKCKIAVGSVNATIAEINPYRYRGYYFDTETGFYYLRSRYYDPEVGRFVSSDIPEILGVAIVSRSILATSLFAYCLNSPSNDKDVAGYISAKSIAGMFSISLIFALYASMLYVNYAKGLLAVGAYITKIATPVAIKALWWKPSAAAAIIVAAVAIIVALVGIHFAKKTKAKTKIPSKLKTGNKVKTPTSHKGEFSKKKGGSYTHDKTGWNFNKSKDGHYKGEHWHMSPKNGKTGDYYNVSPEGNVLS